MNGDALADELTGLEREAAAALQRGDPAAAQQHYARVAALKPDHLPALDFLAHHALRRGDFAVALPYYERLTQLQPRNLHVHYNLAMAQYALRRHDAALQSLSECVRLDPACYPAWLYGGLTLEALGRPELAVKSFYRAARLAEALDPAQLDRAARQLLAHASAQVGKALDQRLRAILDEVARQTGEPLDRIRGCADIFVGKRRAEYAHPKWRPGLMYIPDLPVRPFLDRADFPWTAKLEAAIPVILRELAVVLSTGQGVEPYVAYAEGTRNAVDWQRLNHSPDWSTFHFFRHGDRIEENCRRCPKTAALLDEAELMRVPGYGPEAMFSILKPHTDIKRHYGSVNGRVVLHLPLIIPPNCGALEVCGEARPWVEGQCLAFDDSFEHAAWNHSDHVRVVLIFDAWNPALSAAEREAFARVLVAARKFEAENMQPAP